MRVERGRSSARSMSIAEPVYVVELWTSRDDGEQWRLLDAEDIDDVLDWARRRQQGRVLTVSVEHHDEYGTSVLRLLGPARAVGGSLRSA
ncbi:hypothetical protein [Cellulomonas sp.]|uniref:hypothetical protein n=1 Tax=Cellulomonas sp. TaxID=40001 RepID=UPI003BA86ED5